MSDNTKIEWTDSTWNVITGCSVVSNGCKHCYAMKLAGTRLKHHPSRAGLTVDTKNGPVWTGEVRFNGAWLDQPLRWKKPRMIFVCAHGDLFHEDVPDAWIDRVFAVMALAPQHTFQVLTKRAERMRKYITGWPDGAGRIHHVALAAAKIDPTIKQRCADAWVWELKKRWPLPNVWMGVSVEDQAAADERIPLLLQTPAAVRWISMEPLLGPVDLRLMQYSDAAERVGSGAVLTTRRRALDWVVVGGESGPNARPMNPAWARSLRDQCCAAGVPFLFKQWGEWGNSDDIEAYGKAHNGYWETDPEDGGVPRHEFDKVNEVFRVGKKAAGRLLDGCLHDGYPDVR